MVAFQLTTNQLLYQQKRYRGKINIRKPRIPFYKSVLNQLLTPFYINPNKDKTIEEFCASFNKTDTVQTEELTAYDVILAREARHWFENSRMICCLHMNSIGELEKFDTRVPLHKANIHYKYYSPHIVRAAIKDSPFEALKPLICQYTAFLCSPEIDVATVQNVLRKTKKMYLIAGVLEGQILKLDQFLKYGNMDITLTQLGLVQVLQSAGGVNLNRQLTHHQSTLVSRLKQIGTNETTSEDKQ